MTVIEGSAKETWQLARFTNRSTGALLAAYTDSDSTQVFAGTVYTSVPELEIKLPKNTGGVDKSPCNFIVPIADQMTLRITDGVLTNLRINVAVTEIVKSFSGATQTFSTFIGEVVGAAKNFSGRRDTVALSALSAKSMLERIHLGIPCNHHCGNALGDRYCTVNLTTGDRTRSPEIVSIDGKEVTVIAGAINTGLEDRFYSKGFMTFDGLTVMVHDWRNEVEGDKDVFFMMERVPDEWLNTVVSLRSGCDKTIETCRFRYNNEPFFNGRGFAIPSYHPQFEDGGERQ